ncbi:hypothetical protein TIFTF001_009571 [Ficus carica]|uniref:Uncharacterized protein n=1 Tax=Ficus carica TaxID=3494 RepID=A0AA87ZV14_FICCA|nr:hypothetical protein TIFTF001_009571 [Ficus carica]
MRAQGLKRTVSYQKEARAVTKGILNISAQVGAEPDCATLKHDIGEDSVHNVGKTPITPIRAPNFGSTSNAGKTPITSIQAPNLISNHDVGGIYFV